MKGNPLGSRIGSFPGHKVGPRPLRGEEDGNNRCPFWAVAQELYQAKNSFGRSRGIPCEGKEYSGGTELEGESSTESV